MCQYIATGNHWNTDGKLIKQASVVITDLLNDRHTTKVIKAKLGLTGVPVKVSDAFDALHLAINKSEYVVITFKQDKSLCV